MMNLQGKICQSAPTLFRASKSEQSVTCRILKRTLSHIRPISALTTPTTHGLDLLCPENKNREFQTWRIYSIKSQDCCPHTTVTGCVLLNSVLGSTVRRCEVRRFSTSTHHSLAKKAHKTKAKAKKLSLNEEEAEGIVDLKNLKLKMEEALAEMSEELAAKAPLQITSGFLDNIMVDTGKGKKTPLYELAQVKTNSDSFSIEIQSSFPNATKLVASAINEAGFNMQPTIKGSTITVIIPLFTSDHKSSLEKIAKGIANRTKDALRKVRQKGMVDIRNNKEGQSKDLIHRIENQVQQLTNHYNEKVDMAYDKKVKEIKK